MQQWIRCPRCGANNAPGQRFCNACGTPLPSACPNCGTPVNPGATFCPRCGMQFGGQQGYYQPQQPGYPPQQPGYPPQTGYYPPQQPGYPPQQPGYPPQQPGYPPQTGYYPPQQPGYPPQQPGYPPQQPGYPPQQPGYPPPPPPQQPGYPPQQGGYPPRPGAYPPPPPRPAGGGGGGGGKGMLVFLLILLLAGLGGFGYWAYTQGYLKSLPFKIGSDNKSSSSSGPALTTAPKISNVKITQSGVDGFCVMWDTDQFSDSLVEYGPKGGTAFPNKTELDKNLVLTSHGVCVKGLSAKTDYQYRVVSTNKDGLKGTSETNFVSTPSND